MMSAILDRHARAHRSRRAWASPSMERPILATASPRRRRSITSVSARSSSVSLRPAIPASTRGAVDLVRLLHEALAALLESRDHAAALEPDVEHGDECVESVLVA